MIPEQVALAALVLGGTVIVTLVVYGVSWLLNEILP